MGNTTNNNWPTPVATDLVKDGWEAIKDLGDAIDTTLGVYGPSGLTLVNSTTATGVATISIGSDASPLFTSTYKNYRIILQTEASSTTARTLSFRLRQNVTDVSSAVYYYMNQGIGTSGTLYNDLSAGGTSAIINTLSFSGSLAYTAFDIFNPLSVGRTHYTGVNVGLNSSVWQHQSISGLVNDNLSGNGISFLSSAGNFTNAVIKVYGYKD